MMRAASATNDSLAELLREAVARRTPLAISCRVADGWAGFNSRFLNDSPAQGTLVIEYPWSDGIYIPELVPGQTLGLSFRRGARRCVFSATLRGVRPIAIEAAEIPAILINWPEQIFEWQRRLDYRAPAPAGCSIEVCARRQPADPQAVPDSAVRGRLMDVSAGGMSFGFSRTDYPRWDVGDVVECTFRPESEHEPLDVVGRVRYAQHMRDIFRVGIQWFGLETTEVGREVLDRIIDLCAEFQRHEMQRLGAIPTL